MKAARGRQSKTRSRPPPRGQAWSKRHGTEQQISATRFAASIFLVCAPVLSRAAALQRSTELQRYIFVAIFCKRTTSYDAAAVTEDLAPSVVS
jgi:hypothetical protein